MNDELFDAGLYNVECILPSQMVKEIWTFELLYTLENKKYELPTLNIEKASTNVPDKAITKVEHVIFDVPKSLKALQTGNYWLISLCDGTMKELG